MLTQFIVNADFIPSNYKPSHSYPYVLGFMGIFGNAPINLPRHSPLVPSPQICEYSAKK